MDRGATSNCIFVFPDGVEFDDIEKIELSVRGDISGVRLTKTGPDLCFMEDRRAAVFFAQEETLMFEDNETVRMQWRWRESNGSVRVSRIITINISEFLGQGSI